MKESNRKYLSKKGIVLLFAALLLGVVTGLFLKGSEKQAKEGVEPAKIEVSEGSGVLVHVCPMNCIPPMDKAGKCPICGMELVPLRMGAGMDKAGPSRLKLTPEAIELGSIQLAKVERKPVDAQVRLFGQIDYDPAHMSYVTTFMPGVIDRIYVKRAGQFVRWGDPLFDIYSSDLLETQRQLVEAMKFVPSFLAFQRGLPHVAIESPVQERKKPESGKRSPEEETALRTINAIRHKLLIMGLPKRDIDELMKVGEPTGIATLYAPMYGQVVVQNAFEGTYVNRGEPIFTLADPQHVWAKLDAYEADYPWIRKGQKVTFETEVYPGERFRGQIVYVDPVFDPTTRTFNIGVIYPDRGGRLKAGMLVRAVIHARLRADGKVVGTGDKADSGPLIIPLSAPLITGKRSVVYVAVAGEEGVFEGREVVLGPKAKDHYVVLEGLKEGDQVVVNGNFKIDSAVQILARPGMMEMEDGHLATGYHRPGSSERMDSDYRTRRRASRMKSLEPGSGKESVSSENTEKIVGRRQQQRRDVISRRKPGTYGDNTRPLSQRRIQQGDQPGHCHKPHPVRLTGYPAHTSDRMNDHQKFKHDRFSLTEASLQFLLKKKVIAFLIILLAVGWGILVSPFDWELGGPFRDPVPVDAIPDIGENQQIVFTSWPGRSPQDVEDQITYPLTVSLMGVPGVRIVRSFSMFGFSSIYVIFQDDTDFYWSRSRILEKLNSLPDGALPEGVRPAIGPDATAMGQVFWYTLEGATENGSPTGGWDLHELRTVQDWYVRYALMSVEGVSEVASVGGFVQEYQVDMDPDLMRIYNVSLNEIVDAVRGANLDVGAQTLEINRVEYLVRGIGFIKGLEDLENAVIKLQNGVPVFVRQVARITLGPAARQGALDKGGAQTVGGVVAVRYGDNPLAVIERVKAKIREISPGMPRKTLPDGTVSQVSIVPFYDRTQLINETLDTLKTALSNEVLITIIVILIAVFRLGGSLLIAGLLPLSVLMCFIGMKVFGVDANIVALSGIAIAIGTMVDMGIIVVENILRHLRGADSREARTRAILTAVKEVSGAVLTAVSTTIVSFLPVFTMEGAEGKLFRPLAFSKTFALFSSLVVALVLIPPLAQLLFSKGLEKKRYGWIIHEAFIYLGGLLAILVDWRLGLLVALIGAYNVLKPRIPERFRARTRVAVNVLIAIGVAVVLARYWRPLGLEKGLISNLAFVFVMMGGVLAVLRLFYGFYSQILTWCLDHKMIFLMLPMGALLMGGMIWQGYETFFGWLPKNLNRSAPLAWVAQRFPGLESEFMPPLDEGSYLFMPTTMPHASIGEVLNILQKQDVAIGALPEVKTVVGKLGRAQSPLDPAPVSMIETLVTYKPKYLMNEKGETLRFKFDASETGLFRNPQGVPLVAPDRMPYRVRGHFLRDENFRLIPDAQGHPFRLWRPPLDPDLNPGRKAWGGIKKPDDIWDALVKAAQVPGTTSAARLQPISARMVMLQSGIRASLGIKVTGPDLETIQQVSVNMERIMRDIPSVDPRTVIADRAVSKPYLEINLDRQALGQYGISVGRVLEVIEFAIGGRTVTTTVEGRERYPVRVRYVRELRDDLEALGKILVPAPDGTQIPLIQMADIVYIRGPGVIKSEDTFLVGYILFDKNQGYAEVQTIDEVKERLKEEVESSGLLIPNGVSYAFTGTYENQQRAEKRLALILPLALLIIFVILYLQFSSVATTALVFSGIAVAWSGGFIMIWLYAQPWFLDFSLFGTSMRELFQVHPFNLSVAIWVGFLALFGIASDDGVVMATYLDDTFKKRKGSTVSEIRKLTISASLKRVRPCLMTTATTLLALIPVLTSTGRGSDIMIPMAIPSFGGMALEVITMLVVPVLYCAVKEYKLKNAVSDQYWSSVTRNKKMVSVSSYQLSVISNSVLMFIHLLQGFTESHKHRREFFCFLNPSARKTDN